MRRIALVAAVVLALAAGCSDASQPAPQSESMPLGTATAIAGPRTESVPLGSRPFTLYVPGSYKQGTAAPLVVLLHGYGASSLIQETYLKIAPEAEKRGVLYATPDGTDDAQHKKFWNATDACCNLFGATVDDSTYLTEVIKAVSAKYTVDAKKVYLVGHSNGAFMAFRMACDHADLIAAIAGLNGAMWNDLSRCKPSRPVSVLNIRGTADATIQNSGAAIAGNAYPSTETTVKDWVGLDGCVPTPAVRDRKLDLVTNVGGDDTTITAYSGCQQRSTVELWTIQDGPHIPSFTADFAPDVMDFLLAQSL